MINNLKALIACAFLLGTSPVMASDLEKMLSGMFEEMNVQVTDARAFNTVSRNGFYAGGLRARNKIFNENLVTYTPPSFRAGCGGIDMFAGSFSFINSEQFAQLLRNIAQNASGYAFQIALKAAMPDVANMLAGLQEKIQKLNQHLGNSCQLAQGIVNDLTGDLIDSKWKSDASIISTLEGVKNDVFSASSSSNNKSPVSELKDKKPDEYKKLVGNIVWKSLQEQNVNSWAMGFTASSQYSFSEVIMSVTGTFILKDINDDQASPEQAPYEPLIRLTDLYKGGAQIPVYTCGSDTEQCFEPSVRKVNVKGLEEMFKEALMGGNASLGIMAKWASTTDAMNQSEKNFIQALPSISANMLKQVANLNVEAATAFASEVSRALALNMAFAVVDQTITSAHKAVSATRNTQKALALQQLTKARQTIFNEYTQLTQEYGSLKDVMATHKSFVETVNAFANTNDVNLAPIAVTRTGR